MKQVFSKVQPETLLHVINKIDDIGETRNDICPDDEFLQVACFELPAGKTFRAHKHIKLLRGTDITQESWIVVRGKVKAILYDLDDTVIHEEILEAGDCSITFRGGHNYESMEDGSLVYEYKTGPYIGQSADKVFVGEGTG